MNRLWGDAADIRPIVVDNLLSELLTADRGRVAFICPNCQTLLTAARLPAQCPRCRQVAKARP